MTVPGAVSAWVELHAKFGRLPFARLFEPAIGYGREGFLVSPTVAAQWAAQVPSSRSQPGFAEAFLPRRAGAEARRAVHASRSTRRRWRRSRRPTARRSTAASSPRRWRRMRRPTAARCSPATWPRIAPIGSTRSASTTAATRVHEIPPNGQGIVALIALGMLQHFDMASLPVDSADSVHLQIEAIKLAFADALAYVADIDHMQVRPDQLLDKDYLRQRAKLIDPKRAQPAAAGTPERRHGVPHRCGRRRDDGVDDPVELHGLRLGRGGARHGDLAAEPRRRASADARASESGWAAKAPVSHHHSRLRVARTARR